MTRVILFIGGRSSAVVLEDILKELPQVEAAAILISLAASGSASGSGWAIFVAGL